MTRRYALITPARNEAENLKRLAAALEAQTVPPEAWVIVDDGSDDATLDVARSVLWAQAISSPHAGDDALARGRRTGRDVIAFHAGVAALHREPEVVVKLDADVSFEPDFFERLLAEFDADPTLGIASGTCWERDARGEWRPYNVTRDHVRGATRAWRWACWRDVSPLIERYAWDHVDEIEARIGGWSTRSIRDLPFLHHRPVGSRDGGRRQWILEGELAWFVGYRFSYVVLRALFRGRREPAAFVSIPSFLRAALRREPQVAADVRRYLRRQQSLRRLPLRARQALGR